MPPFDNNVIGQILVPSVILFFLIWAVIGIAVGVGLIVSSATMLRIFGATNRWVSGRHGSRWLAIPRDIGPFVHRYHRWVGIVFVIGAAYAMFGLLTATDIDRAVAAIGVKSVARPYAAWIAESVKWFLVVGSAIAIVVGILLGFLPRALGMLESRLNQWVSTRQLGDGGDTMHLAIDRWVETHPRSAGWIITAGSLVVAVNAALMLFSRH
jgi:hypothetical protein